MASSPTSSDSPRLHIVIVGAGMAGLSAAYTLGRSGHKITLLEGAHQLAEIGAGIQLIPSVVKLLVRWGLESELERLAVTPKSLTHRRWQNGKRLGWVKWGDKFKKDYGYPFYQIHRADLQKMLLDISSPYMDFRLNARVSSVDPDGPSVTLANGEVINCDFVLGADGVKSLVRALVVGKTDSPVPTGDAAFRAQLVDEADLNCWVGPGRHIIAYCVRAKELYNIVMLHPYAETDLDEAWDAEGSVKKMKEQFTGWEPVVQKLMNLVDSTLVWPLKDRDPLSKWVHSSGKVALIGDAVHPMLPYRASGAGMAIEDSACLGRLFSYITDASQIPAVLLGYQEMRHPRTAEVQLASRAMQHFNHYPDGPEQEARDLAMGQAMEAALAEERGEKNTWAGNDSNLWANKKKNDEQYGFDAEGAADAWWAKHEKRILASE
ncbi:hypothetical protein DL96DRAFT_1714687 [Flagelloscypha sp. PMI_526]|nr:hypothetical protein DL96DRAFT_1714687 [Flagelloscypha sp. PMI_526]